YDAHRSLRTRFLMPLLQAEHKAYFEKHYLSRALALTFKLPLWGDQKRFLEKFIEPLQRFGVTYDGKGPEVFAPHTETPSLPFPNDAGIVGIIPSAQWEGKRWPAERFRETLKQLLEATSFRFVIFGGPSDHFCQAIAEKLPIDRVFNAQGKWDLLQTTK